MSFLSILLPVRNEKLNLSVMLKILRATLEAQHEVLVVCDSEQDESIPIVEKVSATYPELRLVINKKGRGVINAVRAGVEAANGDVILIMAADEIGPVLAIDDMLALIEDGVEFVSCTRYAHGGRRLGGSVVGGLLSRAANRVFRKVLGAALTDSTTGIKMFRKDVFEELHLESNPVGWTVAFEMSIKAQLKGLRLGEVPIVSIDRLYGGESSFKLGPWTKEYMRWFVWGASRISRTQKADVTVRVPAWVEGTKADAHGARVVRTGVPSTRRPRITNAADTASHASTNGTHAVRGSS